MAKVLVHITLTCFESAQAMPNQPVRRWLPFCSHKAKACSAYPQQRCQMILPDRTWGWGLVRRCRCFLTTVWGVRRPATSPSDHVSARSSAAVLVTLDPPRCSLSCGQWTQRRTPVQSSNARYFNMKRWSYKVSSSINVPVLQVGLLRTPLCALWR